MSTIDKIISKGTTYSIADSQARTALQTLNTRVFNLEQHGGGGGGDAKAIGRACYNLLAKAVYTENVTTLMSALWALVDSNLVSISAVFTQGATVIYPSTALDSLKSMLVVTAHYDDGTTAEVNDYILSGTLTEGASTITATYGGKTTTFNVIVSAIPAVTYTITNNLTHCTNNNAAVSIAEGESYSTTITADEGYALNSVVCSMGGIAQTVVDGVISIASVTGNIVITASAVVPVPTTQYALHQVAGYAGQVPMDKNPQDDGVVKMIVTLDLPTQSAGSNKVLFNLNSFIGFNNSEWVCSLSGFTTDKTLSEIMGQGKQTVTFSGWASVGNWKEIKIGFTSSSYNPEVTWYEIKMLDGNDNVVADFKPTANVGDFYDSIGDGTVSATTTTGLSVSEVTE